MMRKPFAFAALIGSLIAADVMAMDQADFADYVWGRAGDGAITHRVSTGTARDIDSGKMVARLEGNEVAMAVQSKTEPGTVYHIARAFLLYRDPDTDAVLAAYPSSDPDAQTGVSAYSYVDGAFVWRLGSPANDAPPRTMPGRVDCERQGPVLYCLRGTSYDREAGMTVLEYRWTVDRTASSPEAAARTEFAETEPPSPGISEGPVMIRLTSYRAPAWEAVPDTLREWIETEAPGFAILPDDIAALIEAAGFAP
jgi:hypothetical protein